MDLTIGIIGVGIVGSAVEYGFAIKQLKTIPYDKYKKIGKFENILSTNIVFLCLPTLYSDEKKEYDKSSIHEICTKLEENNYQGIIILKSTVEPGTTESLAQKYKLNILHSPEFLSARSNFRDFSNQSHIVIGTTSTIKENNIKTVTNVMSICFPSAQLSECKSEESEAMKIFINSFYSVKIQFFNELYLLCQKSGMNFDMIRNMMLKNNWINPMHTQVPGTDGKISYGGMCFPKDTNALLQHMIKEGTSYKVLDAVIKERNELRDD